MRDKREVVRMEQQPMGSMEENRGEDVVEEVAYTLLRQIWTLCYHLSEIKPAHLL